ncbi:MAG: metallophosphoesterase [Verrucomicrobiota bacterium]
MPIHLLPHRQGAVTRRSALRDFAILSTAALVPATARSEQSKQRWALLSDTHIAADPEAESRGINMAEHLRRVVAEVVEEMEGSDGAIDGLIIDGDCAFDDGQKGDYTLLLEILAPLREKGLPIHFTLGNHDDRDHFYAEAAIAAGDEVVSGKHVSVIETPFANWVLVDTLRFVNKVEGELGEAQRKWIAKFLGDHPDKPAILVGHHYPQVFRTDVIPSDEEIKISGLVDSEPFFEVLSQFPNASAYLYGHSHFWRVKTSESGFHEVNLPPTAYVFDDAKPNGWVLATVDESGLSLELRALDPAHRQHGETKALSWRSKTA